MANRVGEKSVLLTGGSGGIGAKIISVLEADDYLVISPTKNELNLSDPESIEDYLSSMDNFVPSALVLAAGVNKPSRISDITLEMWTETLTVNLSSALLMFRNLCPKMASAGGGRIVVLSSSYAVVTKEGRAAYSVSKAGLEALVRSAALEYASSKVLINIVSPGFVDTDMTRRNNNVDSLQVVRERIPLGRLAEAEEVAHAVKYLISNSNTYMTGARVQIDGGFLLC